ncbi:MAG: adenylosuccinate lyase [Sphingobacteriales bacterium]|jgi:adenylosuccinate lyase
MNPLTAISPIDGRYHSKTKELKSYYSEAALIQYRIMVEIEYFIALYHLPLPQLKGLSAIQVDELRTIYNLFDIEDAEKVKEYEKITNHDVKAVEYFVKEKFDYLGIAEYKEFIHFGLTSQDINNTALPLLIKDSLKDVYEPLFQELLDKLIELSDEWKNVPMLARTHGQPASPTRLGKEINVFIERLKEQFSQLSNINFSAKFGGATGNFNAHKVAYPDIDWKKFANNFIAQELNLKRSQYTTQIEHYDNLAALCDCFKRINTIILDLSRDMWTYISMDYFKQKIVANEVGSSAMPHKVNPIDFENAEGNLGIANAIFEHLSAKLPISRLQRDLTDSTVTRNMGVPMAHTVLAFKSALKGLNKVILNESALHADLEKNWAVVAEGVQTILRREGYPQPYEALKDLTRVEGGITQQTMSSFIDGLDITDEVKSELKALTPHNYTGI